MISRNQIELFLTALCQVTFVAMNVVFIAHARILAMICTGFMISLIWTINVKKIAISGWPDRFSYAAGAGVGTLIGYLISHWIDKLL